MLLCVYFTIHLVCVKVDAPGKHMVFKNGISRKVASAILEESMCVWREVYKELQVLFNFSSGQE